VAAESLATPTADPRGLLHLVGRLWLLAMGWRLEGALPPIPRYVLIVAPHTSNSDFFVGLAAKWALGLRAKWLGKHTIFRGPLDPLLRALGGVPVDRSHPDGTVEAVLAEMQSAPTFVLALAPEGTRRLTEGWKTGFYRIAVAARVPVLPVAFDWSTRTVRLRTPYQPIGDAGVDIPRLRAMYEKRMAKHPELFNDIHDELPSEAR
jgi:1-acyl-sn-glycerol-3-phosphate acyltransferase